MIWSEPKLIISRDTVSLSWLKMNVMCPTPVVINSDTVRIFLSFCDETNKGRIGFVDIDRNDPSSIKGISQVPCMDLGAPGTFDDSGVLPSCVIEKDKCLYLFYCGFQRQVNVPYTSLLGLAVSEDGGSSFHRIRETPILEREQNELFIRTGAFCACTDDNYELFYASGGTWFDLYEGKKEPIYNLKRICSDKMTSFDGEGEVVIDLVNDEYGITIPQLIKCEGKEYLLFSVRSRKRGYRLEYATKENKQWVRRGEIGIANNATGWFQEMQCFGKILSVDGRTILFFSGNHYGMGGMGWTELLKKEN